MSLATVDPTTGRVVRTFDAHTLAEIEGRLSLAKDVFARTRFTSIPDRAKKILAAAEILEKEKRRFGELMTLEMGKPIKAAIAEAEKCAVACRYYAENAPSFLADRKVPMETGEAWIAFQPLGPILAIMPWNFPFWQVFRFAAPALMAGNVGLLKHASNVPQCALAIEDIFSRAGFERGAFQTLLIGAETAAGLIADHRVVAVTLTGSEGAGRSVAEHAGKNLKKTVLELGGSDPFIVLPSADLDAAVSTAVTARMINNGQSCIAAKRFIVHSSVYEKFLERFVAKVSAVRVGNPMDDSTELGPLATAAIRDDLHKQVERTIAMGGRLLTGGKLGAGEGFFYEPTVIDRIPPGSPSAVDELFGPVASVFEARDLADAISIANSTSFGLGASAWTNDAAERERLVEEIEAGVLFINDMVASDSRLPFGGVKSSGYGRELSDFGIREFVNIKTIRIAETKKRPPEAGAQLSE